MLLALAAQSYIKYYTNPSKLIPGGLLRIANTSSNVHAEAFRASLVAGLEYGTERWNGKWNRTVNVHSYN